MKIYVYKIWFPTSKKCYIGQTQNLDGRLRGHFKSGNLICKALWKYDDWQVFVLHIVKDRDAANSIEIEEIRNHSSVAPNGYNLTHGGEGLYNPSEETRKRMSKNNCIKRPEIRKKISESGKGDKNFRGHHHSEETRKKMSESHKGEKHRGEKNGLYGKHHSEETRRKMKISSLKRRIREAEGV